MNSISIAANGLRYSYYCYSYRSYQWTIVITTVLLVLLVLLRLFSLLLSVHPLALSFV